MDAATNALNWFEIPALDLERSAKFYETIFEVELMRMEMPGMAAAMFPMEPTSGKASGCIAVSDMHKPSMEGTFVYLNANPNMDGVLSRVEGGGGEILMPKTPIGANGFMAFIKDTEGNKVGIHSVE